MLYLIINLHTEERGVFQTAHDAAMSVSGLDLDLLTACGASERVTVEQRSQAAERAFRKWLALVRAMSALEQLAPKAAERARLTDDSIQDFRERKDAPQ